MNNKNRILRGLVVVAAVVLFIALALWLSNSGLPFGASYRLEVKFETAGGLLEQSKVLMRGYRIGTVRGVEFEPDGIVVIVAIDKHYRIPVGSTFAIVNYNFIGERAVGITPSASREFLTANSRLNGESQDMMTDVQAVFGELRRRISGDRLDKLAELASKIEGYLANVRPEISVALPPEFKNDLKTLRESVQAMRLALEESGGRVSAMTSDIQAFVKKLDGLLAETERNQAQLDAILKKLNSEDSSAGKLIQDREFWDMTKATLKELDDFLKELRANPKKFVKVAIF